MSQSNIQSQIRAMSVNKFKQICQKIMAGLGFSQCSEFSLQAIPITFQATVERKSTDHMFCMDESWLIAFTNSNNQAIINGLEATIQGAQIIGAQNILVVVFENLEEEIIGKYHEQARLAGLRSALLCGKFAQILVQDYALDEITSTEKTPFSFALLRERMRQQTQGTRWRDQFFSIPALPIHVDKVPSKDETNMPTGSTKRAETTPRVLRETDLFGAIYQSQSFLLLGEPGAGKTTCLQELAEELAGVGGRTPVFLFLNRFEGNLLRDLGDALCEEADSLSEQDVEDLLTSGALTVILDGLNEVQSRTLQPELVRQINELTNPEAATGRSHWIISSRSYDYQDAPLLKYLDRQTWELLPLTSDMVYEFLVKQLGEQQGERVYSELGTHMREICSNPLLLNMVLSVYQKQEKLPTNRGSLYHHFVNLLLRRGKRLPNNQKELANLGQLLGCSFTLDDYCRLVNTVLAALAKEMQEMGTTAIGAGELQDIFTQSIQAPSEEQGEKIVTDLQQSLLRRGILRFMNGKIAFFHHTFQEYFYAKGLEEIPLEKLIPAGPKSIRGADREALVFLSSSLTSSERLQALIKRLLSRTKDGLLAYELMQSANVPLEREVGYEIARAIWQQSVNRGIYVGENKRSAHRLEEIAQKFNQPIKQFLRNVLTPTNEQEFALQLLKFYQELEDLSAQQQLVIAVDKQEAISNDLLFRMAITVSNEGNRQEAIQLYTEYLERNPKASAAYGNRANLYKALGDLEKAEADYKSAISLNPQDPVNRSNYARLLIEQNQEELAIEELKAAIASTSKYYDPFVQLGNLLKEKEPVMALAYLEEAVKLTSDATMQTEYFEQVLELQEKLGYHARAMSSIRRLIDLNPASQKTNVWKERFARLNAAYRQDAEKYRVVNGEASLAAMARSVLDSTGWRVDHAGLQWMRVISDKQKDLSPLLVLLLDVPQVTEDVVHERISALESDEKEIKGLLLLANTDVIARDARIYIVQRDYPVALITAMEIREALLRGRQHCDVLIENALKRAKERRDPFSYKQLVSERSEFFGRESRKEEFTALLLRHELVGLYGIHKIGKSSFLRQVRQHLAIQARHITPVWIEMSTAIKNPPDLYRDILRELMGGVARIEQKVLTSERFQQELYAFQKRRQQDGGSHQILLILDEYPYLLPGKSGKKGVTDYLEILGLFKILSQEGWFNFLPCGRTTALSNALSWPEGENPFIGMLQEQFLEPLTREEVDELIIVTGAKAGMKFKDEAIECMWTMAGGHPSFTRELGSRILRGRSGITSVINRSMVEEAVEGILHSGTELNLLRKIYQQELEEEEQRIVAKLAISNQPLALPQLFPDNATTDERRQVRTAVENLVATSVISEDGQKHFSHRYELLRRVILQDLE